MITCGPGIFQSSSFGEDLIFSPTYLLLAGSLFRHKFELLTRVPEYTSCPSLPPSVFFSCFPPLWSSLCSPHEQQSVWRQPEVCLHQKHLALWIVPAGVVRSVSRTHVAMGRWWAHHWFCNCPQQLPCCSFLASISFLRDYTGLCPSLFLL